MEVIRTGIFKNYEKYLDRDYLFVCSGQMKDCSAGLRTHRPNGRADWQLIYISKGSMEFNGKLCREKTLYVYKPHEPQDYITLSDGCCYYWLHFGGSRAEVFLMIKYMKTLNTATALSGLSSCVVMNLTKCRLAAMMLFLPRWFYF